MVHVVVILDLCSREAITSLTSKEVGATDLDLVVQGSKGYYRCSHCDYSNDKPHYLIFKMDLSDPQKRLVRGSARGAPLHCSNNKNKKRLQHMHHIHHVTASNKKKERLEMPARIYVEGRIRITCGLS